MNFGVAAVSSTFKVDCKKHAFAKAQRELSRNKIAIITVANKLLKQVLAIIKLGRTYAENYRLKLA